MTRPGGKGQAQGSSAQPIHSGKSKEEEDDEDNEAEVSCVLQDDMKLNEMAWHSVFYRRVQHVRCGNITLISPKRFIIKQHLF